MGGNALKLTKADRMTSAELLVIKYEFRNLMTNNKKLGLDSYYFVQSYSEKSSHGDIDVLCFFEKLPDKIIDDIKSVMCPNEIHKNDNVISFDFRSQKTKKIVQIDFIFYDIKYYESATLFHDYNDLGNFIGRLAKGLGLKFSPKGLLFDFKSFSEESLYFKKNFELTNSMEQILKIVDLDYEIYLKGFDNLNSIYNFITSSKLFNPRCFLKHTSSEYTNSQQRHRDIRRPSYLYFEDVYLKENPNLLDRKISNKLSYIETIYFIMETFGIDIMDIQIKFEQNLAIKKIANEKFNANIIIEKFGLTGVELGVSLKKFHSSFKNTDERIEYILDNDVDVILELFAKINNL